MRIIEEYLTTNLEDLDVCLGEAFLQVKEKLKTIDLSFAISDKSNSMKNCLQKALPRSSAFEWIPKTRDGQAPFVIDAKYQCDSKCSSFHIMNFVICLNNREAIGTNFLKLEVSALHDIRKNGATDFNDSNVLGVLVTFSREVLNLGKWDPAYADSSEYSAAVRRYYRLLIKSNIINLRVHN